MGFAHQSTSQSFPFSYDVVFDGLVVVLPTVGITVKSIDKMIGRISGSVGASLFSWGENLALVVSRVGENSTTISIDSSLKVGFNAGGAHRHHRHFEKIIASLSAYLKQPGVVPFVPTTQVPPEGMQSWAQPDSSTRTTPLSGGLPLVVDQHINDWAQVRASNGWVGWVDARLLLPQAPSPSPATDPEIAG